MTQTTLECEECDGRGYHVGPICCGNLTKGGECRGDCAVPEQTICPHCNGTGEITTDEPDNELVRDGGQFGLGA